MNKANALMITSILAISQSTAATALAHGWTFGIAVSGTAGVRFGDNYASSALDAADTPTSVSPEVYSVLFMHIQEALSARIELALRVPLTNNSPAYWYEQDFAFGSADDDNGSSYGTSGAFVRYVGIRSTAVKYGGTEERFVEIPHFQAGYSFLSGVELAGRAGYVLVGRFRPGDADFEMRKLGNSPEIGWHAAVHSDYLFLELKHTSILTFGSLGHVNLLSGRLCAGAIRLRACADYRYGHGEAVRRVTSETATGAGYTVGFSFGVGGFLTDRER